jgi:hypothetical protein
METFLSILESIRKAIVFFYHIPADMWEYGDRYDDAFSYIIAIFFFIVIWAVTLFVVGGALYGTYRGIRWLVLRKHCQHCGNWTIGAADGQYANCDHQQPCCSNCNLDHKAKAENIYNCPIDGTPMAKVINSLGDIIDKCPTCQVILLSESELENIKDQARSEGRSGGIATGIAIGVAT